MIIAGLILVVLGLVIGCLRIPQWLRGRLWHPAPAEWSVLILVVLGWVLVAAGHLT